MVANISQQECSIHRRNGPFLSVRHSMLTACSYLRRKQDANCICMVPHATVSKAAVNQPSAAMSWEISLLECTEWHLCIWPHATSLILHAFCIPRPSQTRPLHADPAYFMHTCKQGRHMQDRLRWEEGGRGGRSRATSLRKCPVCRWAADLLLLYRPRSAISMTILAGRHSSRPWPYAGQAEPRAAGRAPAAPRLLLRRCPQRRRIGRRASGPRHHSRPPAPTHRALHRSAPRCYVASAEAPPNKHTRAYSLVACRKNFGVCVSRILLLQTLATQRHTLHTIAWQHEVQHPHFDDMRVQLLPQNTTPRFVTSPLAA